jgi:hypothetical protein
MLQAILPVVLLLLLLYLRRYHLPPGPPGNVAGEFKNATMPEVFEKWRLKYGAYQLGARRGAIIGLIICV